MLSFAVNTLYSKCRSDWNQLPLSDRQSLQRELVRHLRAPSTSVVLRPSVLQRVADSVAVLAVRSGKGGCRQLLDVMMSGDGGLRSGPGASAEERYAALLVLSALAEEVKRVKVNYHRSQELWEELQSGAAAVFELVRDTLTSPLSSLSAPPRLPVLSQALELLLAFLWPHFVSSERALELLSRSGLMTQLLALLRALIHAPHPQQRLLEMTVDALAYALEAELERLDDDQITAMQHAMQPVYELLVSLIPFFNVCHAMCGAGLHPRTAAIARRRESAPPTRVCDRGRVPSPIASPCCWMSSYARTLPL